MDKSEVTCSSCGTINRLPPYSITRKPKCGKCGVGLPEKLTVRVMRGVVEFRFFVPWAIAISVALAILIISYFTRGPTVAERLAKVSCPTVGIPANGLLTSWNSNPTVSRISMHAESGFNYVLKVEDAETRLPIVTFFVGGGSTLRSPIQAGRFILKVASGIHWCGATVMFGPDTVTECLARKSEAYGHCSIYSFDPTDTWEFDLVRRVGGNLSTQHVPRNEF